MDISKVIFTKHASEKFERLRKYGFNVEKKEVIETVLKPDRIDERGNQYLILRVINETYALRVVYEKRKGYLAVITFYPREAGPLWHIN